MDGELLEIANVRAGYGSGDVLQGVSLSIAEGEIVAVIGRKGVGKTTLMRTVIGLLPATTGAIRFCGDDVTALAARKRSMNGIGYVPQGRQIFPELTVGENLLTGEQVNSFSKDRRLRYDLIYSYFPILRERRQSTRLNSSHVAISYAVFCLKKKNIRKYFLTNHNIQNNHTTQLITPHTLT